MAGKSTERTLSRNLSVNLNSAGIRSKRKEKCIDFWKGKTCYKETKQKRPIKGSFYKQKAVQPLRNSTPRGLLLSKPNSALFVSPFKGICTEKQDLALL